MNSGEYEGGGVYGLVMHFFFELACGNDLKPLA